MVPIRGGMVRIGYMEVLFRAMRPVAEQLVAEKLRSKFSRVYWPTM